MPEAVAVAVADHQRGLHLLLVAVVRRTDHLKRRVAVAVLAAAAADRISHPTLVQLLELLQMRSWSWAAGSVLLGSKRWTGRQVMKCYRTA
jgi:hypothetical protein